MTEQRKHHLKKHNYRVQNYQGNVYPNMYRGNMYPKVTTEELWRMRGFFLLIPDNYNSFWLFVLLIDEYERKGWFVPNSFWIDLCYSNSINAECCTFHPHACSQRACRLPASNLLRCDPWHVYRSAHPTSLAFRVASGSLWESNLYIP